MEAIDFAVESRLPSPVASFEVDLAGLLVDAKDPRVAAGHGLTRPVLGSVQL
jgi:hypothetical protein